MKKYKIANIVFGFHLQSLELNKRLDKYEIDSNTTCKYEISTFYLDEIEKFEYSIIEKKEDRIICKTSKCPKIFLLFNKSGEVDVKVEYFNNDNKVNVFLRKNQENLEINEYTLISMLVNEIFIKNDFLLVHGSAISYKNKGIIFSAPSGTGKSTHSNLWKEIYNDNVEFINDDKPLIKLENNRAYVIGSPWSGKENLNKNVRVPLIAIVFIKQSKINKIEKMGTKEIVREVLINFVHSDKIEYNDMIINNINNLVKLIKFYTLSCDISKEAVKIAYNEIIGENYEN